MTPPSAPPEFEIAPYPFAAAHGLERELGVSHTLAQVLVRRGLADPAAARAFLAGDERHPPTAFTGMEAAVDAILRHVGAGSRITVHGDYDVDGVCSTAILVRCLRRLGAEVDWHLPSRLDGGYGLSLDTVTALAARGTALLVTVDCAITAVDEVAAARAGGIEVVVTDHHQPRADGRLPDAPIVHPGLGGYPCSDLCAAAVAAKLAEALEAAAGWQGEGVDGDLDLVALATVADCVPLRGENRRLVREGLRALAATGKPGLRALMAVSSLDPGAVDARAVGFRLAPRINAAGRLDRADAGLELVLTGDPERAGAIARELDEANARRRDVETRILFAAEAQLSQLPEQAAYVLAGDDWHRGVIGIVASRLAERRHRPVVLIALDGDRGTGSGRSIPAFDLLGGLDACAAHLARHGGHRAAAGLEIERERVPAFARAFAEHASATLTADDLVPTERVDAVVGGDALGLAAAEELERLAPFGIGNPQPSLLVAAATFAQPVAMGEGRHLRFAVHGGGAHSRAVAFGVAGARLPVATDTPADATFHLERNVWNGAVEPRLVLRSARPARGGEIEVVGEVEDWWGALVAHLEAEPERWPPPPPAAAATTRERIDRRGQGIAGTLADLVATGEPVLVVCADAPRRLPGLRGRLAGFALCSWAALEREPALSDRFVHLVALDPPAHEHLAMLAGAGPPGAFAHLAWGEAELGFARKINEHEYGLRASLVSLYRVLRDGDGAAGEALRTALAGDAPRRRSPALAARLLAVLLELGLVGFDAEHRAVSLAGSKRTALERSSTYRAAESRRQDAERYLSQPTVAAAA